MKTLAKITLYAATLLALASVFLACGHILSMLLPGTKPLIAAAPAFPAILAGLLVALGVKIKYRFIAGIIFICVGVIGATWLFCLPHTFVYEHCISAMLVLMGCIGMIVCDVIRFPARFLAWANS